MGRKIHKERTPIPWPLYSEEDIEDMKKAYYINGERIYALNEEIAKEIYNRNFSKLGE